MPPVKAFRQATLPGAIAALCGKLLHGFDYGDIDRIFFRGYSFPPKSVCLILSERCNLRCRMCDIGTASGQGVSGLVQAITGGQESMALVDWRAVIDDLSGFIPRPLVLLTGTEPFVSPHAGEVIDYIMAKKLTLHITTNGLLLEEHAERLAELCRRPFAIDVAVSIDGPPEIHDAIRGVPGVYERAIRGMNAVADARARRARAWPRMNITCTVSNHNYRHLEDFVAGLAAAAVPADAITFNHLWFKDSRIVSLHNRSCGERFPIVEENVQGVDVSSIDMRGVLKQLRRIRERFGNRFRIRQFPRLSTDEADAYYADTGRFVFHDRCTAPWRNVTVTPRGRLIVSPLCFLGDVGCLKLESFRSLWNGPSMRALRGLLRSRKAFPACSRCCMLFGSHSKFYRVGEWISGS